MKLTKIVYDIVLGLAISAWLFLPAIIVVDYTTHVDVTPYELIQTVHTQNTIQIVSKREFESGASTAWAVAKDEKFIYFVTAKHSVGGEMVLRLFSHHKAEALEIPVLDVYTHASKDVAIVVIERHENLAWIDTDLDLVSEQPQVGDPVAMVGYPIGYARIRSTGYVSYVTDNELMVQIAAAPGNSGSAVINEAGKVIGILSQGWHDSMFGVAQHMWVIVPADIIQELLDWYFIQD